MLKKLELKVTPPNEFNDPFEFSPIVRIPNPKAYSQKTVKEILSNPKFFNENRLEFPGIKNFQEFQKFVRANLGKVAETLTLRTPQLDESLDVLNIISEIHGVICFSADPIHPLMWAHYANSHKGVVLEFNEKHDAFQSNSFFKVDYDSSRVEYNPDGLNQFKQVELFAKRKSIDWKYEQEYRLIVDLANTKEQIVHGQKIHLLDIPPEILKSVTLGLRASKNTREKVLDLISKPPLVHVKAFEIQSDKKEFKLHRIELNPCSSVFFRG